MSASDAGQLHEHADRRIGRIGRGLERRLDGRQRRPDVDHDRRERQVLVVGVRRARRRRCRWTHRRTGRCPRASPPSAAGSTRMAMPDDEGGRQRRDVAARPRAPRLSLGVVGVRRGRRPSSARPSHRPRRARAITRPCARTALAICAVVVEEALDLALVQADAHDLRLEVVGDVGELGLDAHVAWQPDERIGPEAIEPAEVVPQRVREVLVERDHSRVVRARASPSAAAPASSRTPTSRQSWWSTWPPTPSGK